MKYTNILAKIWLSDIESRIYLDLLNNWSSNIVEISNRTGIHRPVIYKIIPLLKENSLISEVIKWKRRTYKAESPEYLKNLFENLSNNFNYMIPELQELYESKDSKPNIKILKWKKWIKEVFADVVVSLKTWESFYRYSSRNNFWWYLPSDYKELRDKKKIQRMVITSELKAKAKWSDLDRDVVHIPRSFDLFEDNIAKLIYSNKIAIIDYNTLDSVIIENKLLAKFEEKVFRILFKLLKKLEENN